MRERANNLYSVFAYFITKVLAEVPGHLIAGNLFLVLIWWSCQLNDTFSWKYWATSNNIFILF